MGISDPAALRASAAARENASTLAELVAIATRAADRADTAAENSQRLIDELTT